MQRLTDPYAATRGKEGQAWRSNAGPESAPARYRPRRPSLSMLYRFIQEHRETSLAQCRDGHDDGAILREE